MRPPTLTCLALVLLLTAGSTLADINTSYLPQRPAATLATAVTKAKKEVKAVFLILYDDRETIPTTLNYFFDSPTVKKAFEEHFVICVRDRRRSDVAKYDAPDHAWNRARFVILTPAEEQIAQGRFLRNDEAGLVETEQAVKSWLNVKARFAAEADKKSPTKAQFPNPRPQSGPSKPPFVQ